MAVERVENGQVIRQLPEIIEDTSVSNEARARECLVCLWFLPQDDIAYPAFAAAAQTFASLAIADSIKAALTDPYTGQSLGEVFALASASRLPK